VEPPVRSPSTVKPPAGGRLALAFVAAAASDVVGAILVAFPPIVLALDLATAGGLWLLLGRPGLLLAALVLEAVPGFGALPFWTLVVLAIAVTGRIRGTGSGA